MAATRSVLMVLTVVRGGLLLHLAAKLQLQSLDPGALVVPPMLPVLLLLLLVVVEWQSPVRPIGAFGFVRSIILPKRVYVAARQISTQGHMK
jgi:hypothetical protein